jgi:hypothetical protein
MTNPTQTRRGLLKQLGAISAVGSSLAGCAESDGGQLGQTGGNQTGGATTTTPIAPESPAFEDLPDAPYLAALPAPEETMFFGPSFLSSTRPRRAYLHREQLGTAYRRIRTPRGYRAGETATIAVRTPYSTYFRAHLPIKPLRQKYEEEYNELEQYRGFHRFAAPRRRVVELFSETTRISSRVPIDRSADLCSKQLIETHHRGGERLPAARPPFADVVEHLPQGLVTTAHPDATERSSIPGAAAGQSLFLDPNDDDRVQTLTVVAFDRPHAAAEEALEAALEDENIGPYPITDPEITWDGTTAMVESPMSKRSI